MLETVQQPSAFDWKRRRCRDCGLHRKVGGNPLFTKVYSYEYSKEEIRANWEDLVWCDECHQWVALRPGIARPA